MKKIRGLFISVFLILIILSLTACGLGKSKNKGAIQIGGNKKVTGDNGESLNYGENLKWPKEFMGNLPEPNAKITTVLKDENKAQCTVAFNGMSPEEAKNYTNKIKELGYKAEVEVSDADGIMLSGTAQDGSQACFTYNMSNKEGTIFYSKGNTNVQPNNPPTNTSPDMTDLMPWPKDFIKGVSELKGKIVNVSKSNDNSITVSVEYVDKKDFEEYVAQLKKNGYTVESSENTDIDSIDFSAYNASGDWVHVHLTIEQNANRAIVEMEKATN